MLMISQLTSEKNKTKLTAAERRKTKPAALISPMSAILPATDLYTLSTHWSKWTKKDVNASCPSNRRLGKSKCKGGLPRLRFALQTRGQPCAFTYIVNGNNVVCFDAAETNLKKVSFWFLKKIECYTKCHTKFCGKLSESERGWALFRKAEEDYCIVNIEWYTAKRRWHTLSRQITKVKHRRAGLVPGWVTTREHPVL